jgi:hypothetical protein
VSDKDANGDRPASPAFNAAGVPSEGALGSTPYASRVFTGVECESIAAMRENEMTDAEIAFVITIARTLGKRIGTVGVTYLVARKELQAVARE